jgi:hypothetical protein
MQLTPDTEMTVYVPSETVASVVLAIGSKVRGFKPSLGDGFLRAIKISSTPSFREEEKRSASCRKILRYVKITLK